MQERMIDVNGVTLHCVTAGSGPLVILLHGFPEFWYGWRNQIVPIAAAGFRVVAPDMRGYNLSSKPRGLAPYRGPVLADDIAALVRALGESRCSIVGHDWGGGVTWLTAMLHPESVDRIVVMNCPHPVPFLRELKYNRRQQRKSGYMTMIQLPWLPEIRMRRSRFRYLREVLRKLSSRPEGFTPEDVEKYVEAWSQPGALTAELNYYRAMRKFRKQIEPAMRPIQCPVLIIWGQRDPVFVPEVLENFSEWVPNLRIERLPEANHFVQSDAPDEVNRLIIDFLREGRPSARPSS
jgi:pimeloyl-ACP methyl ester carboxylesterase